MDFVFSDVVHFGGRVKLPRKNIYSYQKHTNMNDEFVDSHKQITEMNLHASLLIQFSH